LFEQDKTLVARYAGTTIIKIGWSSDFEECGEREKKAQLIGAAAQRVRRRRSDRFGALVHREGELAPKCSAGEAPG
jgi:hypothetical protein